MLSFCSRSLDGFSDSSSIYRQSSWVRLDRLKIIAFIETANSMPSSVLRGRGWTIMVSENTSNNRLQALTIPWRHSSVGYGHCSVVHTQFLFSQYWATFPAGQGAGIEPECLPFPTISRSFRQQSVTFPGQSSPHRTSLQQGSRSDRPRFHTSHKSSGPRLRTVIVTTGARHCLTNHRNAAFSSAAAAMPTPPLPPIAAA